MSNVTPFAMNCSVSLAIALNIAAYSSMAAAQSAKPSAPAPKPFIYSYTEEAKMAAAMDVSHLDPSMMRKHIDVSGGAHVFRNGGISG